MLVLIVSVKTWHDEELGEICTTHMDRCIASKEQQRSSPASKDSQFGNGLRQAELEEKEITIFLESY